MKLHISLMTVALTSSMLLSACAGQNIETKASEKMTSSVQSAPIDVVLAGDWREDQGERDVFRHPKETLAFFGLAPGQSVIEVYPGGGWYTNVIAPYLKATGGTYIAAGASSRFKENFGGNADVYGNVSVVDFSANSAVISNGQADLVLSFRNVHSWIGRKFVDKAFSDFYSALKPGGILGIVEHRLPESGEQDLNSRDGYVQVSYVKALAAEAGFEFVGSSEINANPKDTADHPFGVWTLPPVSASSDRGKESPAGFDAAKYEAIGESDRFTLKFRKPK